MSFEKIYVKYLNNKFGYSELNLTTREEEKEEDRAVVPPKTNEKGTKRFLSLKISLWQKSSQSVDMKRGIEGYNLLF